MFDYRHALACVEIGAICPDITEEDVQSAIPQLRNNAPQNKPEISSAKEQSQVAGQKKSIFDRALDAMEGVVTADKPQHPDEVKKEQQIKKRVWMIYGGVVGVALILALLLRGLIH